MSVEKLAEEVFQAVKAYVDLRLESPPIEYCGSYEHDKSYRKGQCATHQGSVWFCQMQTATEPGGGNPLWTLMVKAGAPGRDAR